MKRLLLEPCALYQVDFSDDCASFFACAGASPDGRIFKELVQFSKDERASRAVQGRIHPQLVQGEHQCPELNLILTPGQDQIIFLCHVFIDKTLKLNQEVLFPPHMTIHVTYIKLVIHISITVQSYRLSISLIHPIQSFANVSGTKSY